MWLIFAEIELQRKNKSVGFTKERKRRVAIVAIPKENSFKKNIESEGAARLEIQMNKAAFTPARTLQHNRNVSHSFSVRPRVDGRR